MFKIVVAWRTLVIFEVLHVSVTKLSAFKSDRDFIKNEKIL